MTRFGGVLGALILCSIAFAGTTLRATPPRSTALPDAFSDEQLLWEVSLGDHQYTVPRVVDDCVYIGVNDTNLDHSAAQSTGGGILMCLERATGSRIWQLPIPRKMDGIVPPYHFNQWKCGVCSRPAIDGDRLYIVGPRGDVLCLDRGGQANGNEGPFLDEKAYMGIDAGSPYQLSCADGDIVWRYDMIDQLGVVPHDVCGSSPAIHGDYLYACTSNGVDDTHRLVANPRAPSLIALHKQTGLLAATDGAISGDRILHGTWSSPVVAEIQGRALVLYGGGDGILYAFEPLTGPPPESDPQNSDPQTLNVLWKYDCCPSDYRQRDGRPITYARWNANSPDGPSEIISTPIVCGDRVYVGIGQSPLHGAGQGMLSCLDGVSGRKIWDSRSVGRTLTDVAIQDGLLFVADYSGFLHCFDADTGEHCWQHDLLGGVWCSSPVVVGDKVYISNEKNRLWVLRAEKQKSVVAQSRVRSMGITPVLDKNVLFFPTQRRLFAIAVESGTVPVNR